MTTKIKILIASIASLVCIGIAFVIGITFYNSKISSLVVDTSNTKLVYDINEDFDNEGLIVNTKTNSGKLNMIEEYDLDFSSFKKGVIGQYDILVTYNNLNTKYVVEIKDKGTLAITKNYKFFVGQDFESNSPELTQTTSTGLTNLIENYQIEDFNTDTVGQHTAKIQTNGFTYDVDYYVVGNLDFFSDLVTNVLQNTSENQITSAEGYHFNEDYHDFLEYQSTCFYEDGTYFAHLMTPYNLVSSEWYAWVDTSGKLYEITYETNYNPTCQQYDSQEEAIKSISWAGTNRLPYEMYMHFVNLAQFGINSNIIDEIKKTEVDKVIQIEISYTDVREDETYDVLYEIYYNSETELIEEIKTYYNDFLTDIDSFNSVNYYPNIPNLE